MQVNVMGIRIISQRVYLGVLLLLASLPVVGSPVSAQMQAIPNFWSPNERMPRPDVSSIGRLRFLTTTDFPPFNFVDRSKRIAGFHVDLARAICDELDILAKCQIQAAPWDDLQKMVEDGEAEAIIAGLRPTAELRAKFEFSRTYLYIPGRFVARWQSGFDEPMTEVVGHSRVGLVTGSSHAAWFKVAFPDAEVKTFGDRAAALDALKREEVDLVFSDALSLSFWLTSPAAAECCAFAGGPYFAPEDVAHGMAIAFAPGREDLVAAVDFALRQLSDKGIFAELYLRYFPVSLY
jgi:polar amino acid transport system substrate-binding protein